jgi:hypothetical protein
MQMKALLKSTLIAAAAAAAGLCLWSGVSAQAAVPLFTCRIGAHTVSVSDDGGQLAYRYGTAGKTEMSIVGTAKSGDVLQLEQRFAGMEHQLRFKTGGFSYIVYSSEGNGRTGASATSGLVVMQGAKRLSDKSCSPYAELTLPPDSEAIPQDSDAYSAM